MAGVRLTGGGQYMRTRTTTVNGLDRGSSTVDIDAGLVLLRRGAG